MTLEVIASFVPRAALPNFQYGESTPLFLSRSLKIVPNFLGIPNIERVIVVNRIKIAFLSSDLWTPNIEVFLTGDPEGRTVSG